MGQTISAFSGDDLAPAWFPGLSAGPMKMSVLKFIPFLFALLCFNGCATPSPLSDLTISVLEIKPATAAAAETKANLTLRFVNANEVSAAISASTHKLYLNGTYVGKASTHEPIPLTRLQSKDQTFPLSFENVGAVEKVLAAANTDSVNYRLDSEIFFEVNDERQNMKLTASGQVSVKSLAAALSGTK